MTVDTFQRVVKTLGDSTRLRLLALLERQELSVADLVKLLDLPQSTVSRHLAHLKEQGLLSERRDGAFCYSRFTPPRFHEIRLKFLAAEVTEGSRGA